MSSRRVIPFLVLAITMMVTRAYGIHCNKGCCVTCPRCQTCCELEVKEEKEEKHCYKIECKEICVPCIVFPWQKHRGAHAGHGCGGNCGGNCAACTAGGVAGSGCNNGNCNSCNGCCVPHNGARVIKVRVAKKEKYECPTCSYKWSPVKKGDCCSAGAAAAGESKKADKQPEAAAPPTEAPAPDVEAPAPPAPAPPAVPLESARSRQRLTRPIQPTAKPAPKPQTPGGLVRTVVFDAE